MAVLKNCVPELPYILAEFFNMQLKESCFPDCWKVSLVVPVSINVRERSTPKNHCPVSLLSVVSEVFICCLLLITKRNVVSFLIISMVLGLLNQL